MQTFREYKQKLCDYYEETKTCLGDSTENSADRRRARFVLVKPSSSVNTGSGAAASLSNCRRRGSWHPDSALDRCPTAPRASSCPVDARARRTARPPRSTRLTSTAHRMYRPRRKSRLPPAIYRQSTYACICVGRSQLTPLLSRQQGARVRHDHVQIVGAGGSTDSIVRRGRSFRAV